MRGPPKRRIFSLLALNVVVGFSGLLLTKGLAAGREMPGNRVLDHLEQHRAVAGGADLELVEQLNCSPAFRPNEKNRTKEKHWAGEKKHICTMTRR